MKKEKTKKKTVSKKYFPERICLAITYPLIFGNPSTIPVKDKAAALCPILSHGLPLSNSL